mgnify:FL=1
MSGVEIILRAVGKTAGIEAHPHTLRHSFASHMIEQGVPINYVQAMLGHRCLESTQVYIHISNKTVMGIKSPLDHPVKKKRGHKSKRNAGDANESWHHHSGCIPSISSAILWDTQLFSPTAANGTVYLQMPYSWNGSQFKRMRKLSQEIYSL